MTGNAVWDLEKLVRRALALADVLELEEVGLRLDQALIALTGAGISPPQVDQAGLVGEPCLDVVPPSATSISPQSEA